jgi:hypothetical protein
MSKEHESSDLDRWIDGTRDAGFEQRVARSPELRGELERARAIEASLARRFAPPAELSLPLAPVTPVVRDAPPRAVRLRRALPLLALAAALLLAVGAWLARGSSPAGPATTDPSLVKLPPLDACLDDVFYAAAAADFEPPAGLHPVDPELAASIASSPCGELAELVVVGEWTEHTLDAARVVLLRSGAEPILLFVPKAESTADMCRAEKSDLSLYGGCFNGRPIYELSSLRQSRALPCMRAERLEQL